jgi:hypothetical protein
MRGELPLRIVDLGQGPLIRCLCGAEYAVVYRSTANNTMLGLRSSGPPRPNLKPSVAPQSIMGMIAHALQCETGKLRMAQETPRS